MASSYHHVAMLRDHVTFYLPKVHGGMVAAEALDFPGAVTQGFDLPDARLMISPRQRNLWVTDTVELVPGNSAHVSAAGW